MPLYLYSPPMSPLARLAAAIVSVITVIGAFMLGLVFIAVAVGLGLLIASIAWLRVWWFSRTRRSGAEPMPGAGSGDAIEAEYTVVATERRDDR
jgi:hypothetical protein